MKKSVFKEYKNVKNYFRNINTIYSQSAENTIVRKVIDNLSSTIYHRRRDIITIVIRSNSNNSIISRNNSIISRNNSIVPDATVN